MDRGERKEEADTDYTAAVPLEIGSEVAERADDLLRDFAEEAGLSTALVVDRSGFLVAGISSESDVTIEVISALVAGASGAMRALVAQLGETGSMESLHFGEGQLVYLREIINRFILVGVSDGSRPAGLVRQKARLVKEELAPLLAEIRPGEVSNPLLPPLSSTRSLREVAMERAAQRGASLAAATLPELTPEPVVEVPRFEPVLAPETEDPEPIEAPPSGVEPEPVLPEPREILEPLEFGESEIVIEPGPKKGATILTGQDLAAFSPFEEDEESEEEDDPVAFEILQSGSVFELEEDEEGDEEEGDVEDDIFSALGQEDEDLFDGGSGADLTNESVFAETGVIPGNVFEMEELEPEDDEQVEDIGREINEMMDEEDEETEVRSSGPFYF